MHRCPVIGRTGAHNRSIRNTGADTNRAAHKHAKTDNYKYTNPNQRRGTDAASDQDTGTGTYTYTGADSDAGTNGNGKPGTYG